MRHIEVIRQKLEQLRVDIGNQVAGWEKLVPLLATYNAAIKSEDYIKAEDLAGVGSLSTYEPTNKTRFILSCILSGLSVGGVVKIKVEYSVNNVDWYSITERAIELKENETHVLVSEYVICRYVRCKWLSTEGGGNVTLKVVWMS